MGLSFDKLYSQLKCVARNKQYKFDLSKAYFNIILESPCFYCGKSKTWNNYSYFIDRIDNLKGYTVDNCLPCCSECNRLRMNNFTVDETKIMAEALKKYRQYKREKI